MILRFLAIWFGCMAIGTATFRKSDDCGKGLVFLMLATIGMLLVLYGFEAL